MRRSVSVVVLAFVLACACALPRPDRPAAATGERAALPGQPGLVVVIVLDQLPLFAVDALWDGLDDDGLLASTTGRYRVRFGHASTNTAPGHASILTGVPAAEHGVMANDVWSLDRGDEVAIVDDGEHAVLGRDDDHASPRVLRVPTVGDELRTRTGGAARVVSLSMKARAAVLAGGARATMAVWYEAKLGRFTTSTYYAPAMPAWLAAFNEAHPVDEALAVWEPLEALARPRPGAGAAEDTVAGHADWQGYGRSFPHAPRASANAHKILLASPHSTAWLLAAARAAVAHYELGRDRVPDLLIISISATDYVGHVFGADSWEYADNLARTDRMLADFVRELERTGPVAVLVTSDHGVAHLPAHSGPGSRLVKQHFARELDAAVDRALGDGDWIAAYVQPFVTLTATGADRRAEVVAAVEAFVATDPRIHRVYDTARVLAARTEGVPIDPTDPVAASVRAAIGADPPGELFVVPARGTVIDPDKDEGYGTAHGTPWDYDTDVPVFVRGPGVPAAREDELHDQARVAATIAALLGIEPPPHIDALPLGTPPPSARR